MAPLYCLQCSGTLLVERERAREREREREREKERKREREKERKGDRGERIAVKKKTNGAREWCV